MKEKRINRLFWQRIFPAGVMILIIFLLLMRFSAVSKGQEEDKVLSNFKTMAVSSAQQIETYLGTAARSADIVSYYLQYHDSTDVSYVMQAVLDATDIQDIVVYMKDGTGYRADGSQLTGEEKERFARSAEEKRKVGCEDDTYSGISAFFAVSPIETEEGVQGHVICGYDPALIEQQNITRNFGSDSFYLILDRDGKVIICDDETDNPFCVKTDNYVETLGNITDGDLETDIFKSQMMNKFSHIGKFTSEGTACTLIEVPIRDGEFFLIIGVQQDYLDSLVEKNWKPLQTIVWQILAAIFIFACIVIVVNIVERIHDSEKKRALENKADTDFLTNLNNKIATERKIKQHLATHPDEMALMFLLDIDNFKKINDTMGHAFGDEVLKTLGSQIVGEFRASDIIGRTGGDEFMVFLCNMKEDAIIQREAKRMEQFFRNFQAGDYVKYSATASIGAAVYPRDAQTFEGLYKAADHALYVAKKRGKNQLAFYGDDK